MEIQSDPDRGAGSVNYDEEPLVQVEAGGTEYRVDTGLGSAVAISKRDAGTWAWALVTEGRWDGRRLRARGIDHGVIELLGQAVGTAMADRDPNFT
jgi:hypothetical protein